MRHEKSANLIELARELAVSHMGLTLDDMANKMGVGRRTAERTVSYTHLDVYKRQMFALAGCAHEPNVPNWGHGSRGDGPLAHHPQGVEHIETPHVVEQQGNVIAPPPAQDYNAVSYLTGCTGTVSYTHLDVYKRQIL